MIISCGSEEATVAAVVAGAGGGAGGSMGAMNRYITLQALGDGTYGSVMLGQRVDTGEKVGEIEFECIIVVFVVVKCYSGRPSNTCRKIF